MHCNADHMRIEWCAFNGGDPGRQEVAHSAMQAYVAAQQNSLPNKQTPAIFDCA
jgi:hypothetical protein